MVEQVKVDIDEDAEEESDIGEEIVVGTIGIGIHTNVNPEVRAKRRHRSRPFIKKIVNLTKNHFGGCPDSSKSNVMAVSKFVYEQCKQHNCLRLVRVLFGLGLSYPSLTRLRFYRLHLILIFRLLPR